MRDTTTAKHTLFLHNLFGRNGIRKKKKNAKLSFKRVDDCRFDSNDFSKSRSFIIFVGSLLWLVAAMADHRRSYIAVVDDEDFLRAENSEIVSSNRLLLADALCAIIFGISSSLVSCCLLAWKIWFDFSTTHCKPNLKKKQRLFEKKRVLCIVQQCRARAEEKRAYSSYRVCCVYTHIPYIWWRGNKQGKPRRKREEKKKK